jgi:hypothetical protein
MTYVPTDDPRSCKQHPIERTVAASVELRIRGVQLLHRIPFTSQHVQHLFGNAGENDQAIVEACKTLLKT